MLLCQALSVISEMMATPQERGGALTSEREDLETCPQLYMK